MLKVTLSIQYQSGGPSQWNKARKWKGIKFEKRRNKILLLPKDTIAYEENPKELTNYKK